MGPAYLAGAFSPYSCDIRLYSEMFSGPLEDETLLSFPDMLVLTGLNVAFDRMLHITAYVKTKNPKAIVVAGGPAIRALYHYSQNFFDHCCTGDIEQLAEIVAQMADNRQSYAVVGKQAREYVLRHYGRDELAAAYLRQITALLPSSHVSQQTLTDQRNAATD